MLRTAEFRSPLHAALTVNALGFSGFYLLLPVVPLAASRYGGTVVSGAATAVFMGATVATQFLVPGLSRRMSPGLLLSLCGFALGLPALAYIGHSGAAVFFAATTVRGIGFGVLTAAGSAAVMATTTAEQRGRQIGLYGLAASLPALVLPGAGVRAYHDGADTIVFVVAAVLACSVAFVAPQVRATPTGTDTPALGVLAGLSVRHLRTYPAVFVPFTMAYGAVFTFVPLWERHADVVVLAFAVSFTFARLFVGRSVTPQRAHRFLAATVAVGVAASLALAFTHGAVMVIPSLAIGASVGSAATLTLFLLTNASTEAEHAVGAALWSVAFDGGIGLGALALAAVATVTTHGTVYIILAVLIASALPSLRLARMGSAEGRRGPVSSATPVAAGISGGKDTA